MKILKKSLKQGIVKVTAETLDDLWYLSNIIEPGDLCKGKSERKIKIGGEEDRKAKVVKKQVFIGIKVEKITFDNVLKLNGVVVEGPEDVSRGSYHTLDVEDGTTIEIQKEKWLNYQLDKLNEACEDTGLKVLIICHDREAAAFGLLTRRGLQLLSEVKGDVAKKGMDEGTKGNFYKEISKIAVEYDKQHSPGSIVVASPGFWKEYLIPELPFKGVVQATCSHVGERGLNEVIKRPELKQVLEKDRTRKESALVDEVMTAVSKDEACYGLDDCEEKVTLGAVKTLLVSEKFISESREKEIYGKLESVMKQTESMDGSVHLISSEEARGKLDSLGGVAGVLRWKNS